MKSLPFNSKLFSCSKSHRLKVEVDEYLLLFLIFFPSFHYP